MKKLETIIELRCKNCGHIGNQDTDFSYLGDQVWSCNYCLCKYTDISSVREEVRNECIYTPNVSLS